MLIKNFLFRFRFTNCHFLIIATIIVISIYISLEFIVQFHTEDGRGNRRNMSVKLSYSHR